MGFSSDNGYTPASIQTIIDAIMDGINTQFSQSYTTETFTGTTFYKLAYAVAQRIQANEVKASEVFLKLQQYFTITNEKIDRPVVTNPGLIEILQKNGYIASVKKPADADAGKVSICVDKQLDDIDTNWEDSDDYDTDKLQVCTIIKDSTVAGVVTQGDQVESITLTNGQSFDFKYVLPNRISVWLRLTNTLSENNQVAVGNPDDVKAALLFNIRNRYAQGKDFEPQKYWNVTDDAPWTSQVLLEWSDDSTDGDDGTWHSTVFEAEFDEVYDYKLERLVLVEE